MLEILRNITERLHGEVSEASFEGANIVLYTKNENFFKEGTSKIKEIVKNRIREHGVEPTGKFKIPANAFSEPPGAIFPEPEA
jgi:predicted metal-dependent RNase